MGVTANRLLGQQRVLGFKHGLAGQAQVERRAQQSAFATMVKSSVHLRMVRHRHPIARRIADLADGTSTARTINVSGRSDGDLLADILGTAYLPPA